MGRLSIVSDSANVVERFRNWYVESDEDRALELFALFDIVEQIFLLQSLSASSSLERKDVQELSSPELEVAQENSLSSESDVK